ncbi:MAG: bifunctional UDP-N-acetylglucosamine diphosphorylase/glucosamine-1-phosphate N-acetyltransferase GlmU [Alphaproteobacteria bacterium]|nr:bifunctional UDP-N-acetylglucosamine diphosphorylase/glucosamine-1-phosphate N-acetyltransferase GlmU [Alphaproteobacteria bacterium]
MYPPTALILAAGKGTRMRSSLPKVLHPLRGVAMARWVVDVAVEAGCRPVVVVGHQAERVQATLGEDLGYAVQAEQKGTGHAVLCAADVLPREGVLVVLAGDTPLVRAETLRALLAGHEGLCTVLTARLEPHEVPASAYGRLVRGEDGQAQRVVEAANATPEERMLREYNSGIYAFDARWLLEEVLPSLEPHPPKGELYLTDAVEAAARAGSLRAVCHEDASELMGVNDKAALAEADAALRARINHAHMLAGVRMVDPAACYVDRDVRLAEDVELGPGVVLQGRCVLGEGAVVEAHAVLRDTEVSPGARVRAGTVCEGARIGEGAVVGPMARLREGTVLERGVKVGNFVETKKAVLREGAKASHLSYLGDAEVGAGANIGAGTITCNYDGFGKHRTEIGAGAFIGSNSALVAPVRVGAGAIVGAGSVITRDAPPDALSLTRAPQRDLEGFASKLRQRYAARAASKKAERR